MTFYCLRPAARKGFLLSISRFFFSSTRNRLLSPEVGAYPPSIHKDVHSLGVVLCGACPAERRMRSGTKAAGCSRDRSWTVVVSAHRHTLGGQLQPALRCRCTGPA